MTDAAPRDPGAPSGGQAGRDFDAVLFDFGGVFMDSPFAAAETAAGVMGVPFELLTEVVFGSYDSDTDHPWHRLERGEITFADARDGISDLAVERGMGELDPFDVLASLADRGQHGHREFVVDAVRDLRAAGLRTSVVTNNIAEFGGFWRTIIPLDELFDDVVDSSEVGVRKPSAAIYELSCQRLGVAPERSVFLDDFEGNVVGARQVGLTGICVGFSVESTAVAIRELRRLTGLA